MDALEKLDDGNLLLETRPDPRSGATSIALDPLEWIQRITSHIPDPGRHCQRFYGAYSNRARIPASRADAKSVGLPAAKHSEFCLYPVRAPVKSLPVLNSAVMFCEFLYFLAYFHALLLSYRIEMLIKRRYCEAFQNRIYVSQTWDLFLDAFPPGCIKVPLPPLQSVAFIKYKDIAGVLQTLQSSEYLVDSYSEPGLVCLAHGKSWPATYPETNAVQIRLIAGYGTAAVVPPEVKHAILLKVADLYEHRGGDEGFDKNINDAIESILWPDRVDLL